MLESVYIKFMRFLQLLVKPFSVKYIRKYESNLQKRNHNNDFSLIVHTCVGGVIYHRLGLRFLSPTINLWLQIADYVKLCSNLEYYMEKNIEFVESDKKYPVGRIDDITIYFEHYHSEEEAREKWEDRKKRINYNNLYGIAMIHNSKEYEIIKPLLDHNRFKKLCVLSNVKIDDDRITYISPSRLGNNRLNYLDRDVYGIRRFEKEFDFVEFLN